MDDFVLHLRMARHLRTPEYNELFGGDPMWITEAVGGIGEDGRHMVTKNSYRMLNTLYNLNAAAEAQPHCSVERKPAGELEKVHRKGLHRHRCAPV